MGTVRSIERRMYVRRQTDRELQAARAGAPVEAGERLAWGGIWAGFMVFVGVSTLLLFLVMGIGFSAVNPLNAASWQAVGGGVGIWSIIVLLIAAFAGAWVAARGPRTVTRREGIMRGVVLWGLIMLSTLLLTGWVASGALSAAATAAGGAASVAAPTMQRMAPTAVASALQRNGVTVTDPQATAISSRLAAGDRQGAATVLAQAAGISNDRANALLDQITGQVRQQAQTAGRQAARGAAVGGSAVTWGGFWLALLSLCAAVLGGAVGSEERGLKPPQLSVPTPPTV